MAFSEKTVSEFGGWLQDEGFSPNIIKAFEENEVDGESFLLLNDTDISDIVKPLGARRKLIAKRDALIGVSKSASTNLVQDLGADLECRSQLEFQRTEEDSINGDEMDPEMSYLYEQEHDQDSVHANDNDSSNMPSSRDSTFPLTIVTSKDEHQHDNDEVKVKQEKAHAFSHFKKQLKDVPEPPLPVPFELPSNYPCEVMEELAQKRLSGRSRAKFYNSVCSAIYRFKAHPNEKELWHVQDQILKKYPFLSYTSNPGYLVEALKDKMKYIRNAKPRDRKTSGRATSIDSAEIQKKAKKEFQQFPRSPAPPSIPPGEDKASHTRHLNAMKLEEQKVAPDRSVLGPLMEKTFAFRRLEILEQPKPVKEIIQMYPSLKTTNQILMELNRIFNKEVVKQAQDAWTQVTPKIIEVASKEPHKILSVLYAEAKANSSSVESLTVLAMLMIVQLLPDTRTTVKPSRVIIFIPEYGDVSSEASAVEYPQPLIIIRGSATNPKEAYLICEKMVLSKVEVANIPLILFATYYVFNIQYCVGCTNVFSFLEVTFLNCPPPKRTKLKNFLSMLEHVL